MLLLVVRVVLPTSVPIAGFYANAYYTYDPDASINPADSYERDWLALGELDAELKTAAREGAAGVVYALEFPREQVEGYYRPFQGIRHGVPAVFLGVDEGAQVKQLAQSDGENRGRLRLTAAERTAQARTVTATLPGQSHQKIIVNTHTDGENLIEENGPIALLALAHYFGQFSREERPRTLEFVFHSGHFNGDGPIEEYAERVDEAYAAGDVALVVTLEHLGGRKYTAVDRADGPGRRLEGTDTNELTGVFVPQSPAIVEAISQEITDHDLRRTTVLRGASTPSASIPPFAFPGPGQEFHKRSIPTVGLICGPWTLLSGAYDSIDSVDTELFRAQAEAFAGFIETVSPLPRAALAGSQTGNRAVEETGLSPHGIPNPL